MPGGPKEERLRQWVGKRLARERGLASALARHLGRANSWITVYVNGERDADLDTSIAIAHFFNLTLEEIVGNDPLPKGQMPRPKVGAALRELTLLVPDLDDEQLQLTLQFVRQLRRVSGRPRGRGPAGG